MSMLYVVLMALGVIVVIRAFMLLFFAEVGRRQDLAKHLHRGATDFTIAVVIPYLDGRKLGGLHELLTALEKQDYPANRTGIHIIANPETMYGLPGPEDLPPHVKVWTHPSARAGKGELINWLVDRLLAAGGPSRLFVFLDADDIVRPDFLRNVTANSFDCFAMQGYVALKRPPRNLLGWVAALSLRFINRIENAGRAHAGLSCKLQDTGWVVRQELLEMIPFRQGREMDNAEYGALLSLQGYRVHWAPNVLIYKEDDFSAIGLMRQIADATLNRIRLTCRYGPQLVLQAIGRMQWTLLDTLYSFAQPPHFIIGLIGLWMMASFARSGPFALTHPAYGFYATILVGLYLVSQLLALAVARCSFRDMVFFLVGTPVVYGLGLVAYPFFLVASLAAHVLGLNAKPRAARMGMRFDETQPALRKDAPEWDMPDSPSRGQESPINTLEVASDDDFASIYANALSDDGAFNTLEDAPGVNADVRYQTEHRESILPITNGRNAVYCVIQTIKDTDPETAEEFYRLTFAYKNLTFNTQQYRILDQAYYELQTKLKERGFSIVSCGSCAYFYRPTAGNPHGIGQEAGFCLWGKQGKALRFDTDTVTVVSESCAHYTDISHRNAVFQDWQESLEDVPDPAIFSSSA